MNFLKVVDRAALDVDVDFVESYLKYFTFILECFRIFFTDPDIILILHFSIKFYHSIFFIILTLGFTVIYISIQKRINTRLVLYKFLKTQMWFRLTSKIHFCNFIEAKDVLPISCWQEYCWSNFFLSIEIKSISKSFLLQTIYLTNLCAVMFLFNKVPLPLDLNGICMETSWSMIDE